MRFKEDRQHEEFMSLVGVNNKLVDVLKLLDQFCLLEFSKDVCVTSIYRSAAEQAELYKDVPADKKVLSSAHMVYKAADIRSSDFTDAQIKRMLTFLNCFTYASGQGKPVALYHTIAGNVAHFHLQVDG